ncbi:PREDICTED: membrane-spanning 4-domains subfamily A member 3 [Chrysochloris asiatica]|uniref:Membrane-spanning 4-domains subfamily A member 3 n=1 Tax=Chrysochloris asiatica TaxID=185453 RepID=A0A9B0U905_CHRAS|nr:PREDICTED: membrane-spanning 4-domains subfamily A member 3 [Chrysochloris asiatica]
MASKEVDNAEVGGASIAGAPGREMEPGELNNSDYHPIDGSQNFMQGLLQALGAIQILNGAMILALGVFLGSLQYVTHLFRHIFFFTFYTGYPLWGAVFFIGSGSLSIAAGRKNTSMLMQNSFGMSIASATIAFVGIVFLSINLAYNNKSLNSCQSSQSPDLCIYMCSSSTGLLSIMLILTLLELCITISISIMWCKANCCKSREVRYEDSHQHHESTQLNCRPSGTHCEKKFTKSFYKSNVYGQIVQLMKKNEDG